MNRFCIYNNEILKIENFTLTGEEFLGFGDIVQESVRLYNTFPLFLEQHIVNVLDTLQVLSIEAPKDFTLENMGKQISRLLNVNKVYKGGVCKLVVFRKSSVFAHEQLLPAQYAIFIDSLENTEFEFPSRGTSLLLLQTIVIEKPHLFSMYSAHFAIQHKSKVFLQKFMVDALAYFNSNGLIFHTSIGDVFYVKNDTVFCVSIEGNTFRHPLSDYIIQLLRRKNVQVRELDGIIPTVLEVADEIFIVHSINGIHWVKQCNNKSFGCYLSSKICKDVNSNLALMK